MSQVISLCQDKAESLDEGVCVDAIINDFHVFRFSSSWSAAYETGGLGHEFEGSHLDKGIPCRSYTKSQCRRATIQVRQNHLRYAARECVGPTIVSSVRK